jgi:hypothetical protein
LLAAVPLVFALAPLGGAQPATPACTDTFVNPAGGSWHIASNWDHGLPVSGDTVCIPAGVTVSYTTGTLDIASLQVAGALSIMSGTLTTTSAVDDSTIVTLSLGSTGRLGGSNTIVLTGSGATGSTWSGGTMGTPGDSGTTRLASGASLSLGGGLKFLQNR